MTLYNWLTLFGIPGMIASFLAFIRLQHRQNNAVRAGLRAILRDRLLQTYYACFQRGYAAPDERQNFENMYVQYHALGGNGVMDDVRRKFFNLPMEKKGETPHD